MHARLCRAVSRGYLVRQRDKIMNRLWFSTAACLLIGGPSGWHPPLQEPPKTTYLRNVVNPLAPGLVDCSTSACFSVKRTPQDSASMHSAFGARNVLFLAPLHSPQLRCVLRRRLRMSLRRVTTLPHKVILLFLSSASISVYLRFQIIFMTADI